MSDKITTSHLHRLVCIYIRQSTAMQLQNNRESTDRQYRLVERASNLGWSREQVRIIDGDLGISASATTRRSGFDLMATDVAMGRVGLILALEVSRLARNNCEWYRLLDFCGTTDTLIGDEDGIYHPGLYNDRLLLGLKGTMSEAELHVIRARLNGGILNKAARGELRRGLPIGFVWGEGDGQVLFDPDEAIVGAVRTVFLKFAETGSVRQVWIWFRSEKVLFPSRANSKAEVRWIQPTYHALHAVLTNPVYAGAYVYGRTRQETYINAAGQVCKRSRKKPLTECRVLLHDHHDGFIDWETYEMNQTRIARNTRPTPHHPSGALREGSALLQGLATCGHCGRKLKVYYQGKNSTPGYHCPGTTLVNGRALYCMRIGGVRIDDAVASTFLNAIGPAGIEAVLETERSLESDRDAAISLHRLHIERLKFEAEKAERRYRATEPENRLVARTLETEWERCLEELATETAELERRERTHPVRLTQQQRSGLRDLAGDLNAVWAAPTTTDRDRKELLQTVLEEVCIKVDRTVSTAHLTIRWKGGLLTELDVVARAPQTAPVKTDEDTIEVIRKLAPHYPDAVIAGILNRQGRLSARGERFTATRVSNLRYHWKLPRYQPQQTSSEGTVCTVKEAADILGVAPSTLHRCLNDGIIVGEQITPGAPWRIRVTEELRSLFVEESPQGFMPIVDAMRRLNVSRQTVLQRVKRGELEAVHVSKGRRKGLRVKILYSPTPLFDTASSEDV